MRFDEFQLYAAIYDVYREVNSPRSGSWMIDDRETLCRLVQQRLPLRSRPDDPSYTVSEILSAWEAFGKSPKCGEFKKLELTVIVGRRFGVQCFWSGRVVEDCSADIQVDRLTPGSRGGLYVPGNCVISCGRHNSMRSDQDIEAFLRACGYPATASRMVLNCSKSLN